MIKIAVIDDGISIRKVKGLDFNIEINDNCEMIQYEYMAGDNSHGTICSRIIKKYAPDASLGSIKILQTYTKRGYVNQFKKALEWCIQHDISLINISLGSTLSYDYSILYECVENAYKNGIIIVAALSNKHVVTYPASFQNVIGVETDSLLRDNMYYMKQNCIEGVNVVASSVHNIGYRISNMCNSYSAPLITAEVYKIMEEHGYRDIDKIKIILNDKSFKKIKDYDPLYWPKDFINDIERKNIKPIEIPCIMIKVENIHDRLPCLLNNKFNQNGYNTLLIQTNESGTVDILHNAIAEEFSDNMLEYIASKYESDLIIIGFGDTDSMMKNVTCDILFYQEFEDSKTSNSFNQLLFNRNISCELKVGYKTGNNIIEYIYEKTTKILS